jgi:hypothetical protein
MSVPFIKTKPITLFENALAATHLSTSILGDAIDVTGHMTGVFVTSVIVNSTVAPAVYLDTRVDTTNWVQYATLHPDMTTTANAKLTNVSNFANSIRIRMNPITTTSYIKFNVKAEVFAK